VASKDGQSQVKLRRSLNKEFSLLKETTFFFFFQGFQNMTVSETSLQEEQLNLIEEVQLYFSMLSL